MKYTVDYFIRRFSKIPENLWFVGGYENTLNKKEKCAGGHCGMRNNQYSVTKRFSALNCLIGLLPKTSISNPTYGKSAAAVNDGFVEEYQQPTPKQRILAALYDIKKMQDGEAAEVVKEVPKPKEVIRYVSVPESIKEQKEELILN